MTQLKTHGSGIATFINNQFSASVIILKTIFNFEHEELKLSPVNKSCATIILSTIYRQSNISLMTFVNEFSEYLNELESVMNVNTRFVLVGDYNINFLQCDEQQNVASFINTTFYIIYILVLFIIPVKTSHSATLMDNLLCNKSPAASGIICSYISDHLPIFAFLDCLKYTIKPNLKHPNNNYNKV